MSRKKEGTPERRRVRCSIEIPARATSVFEEWSRFERLPRLTGGLQHVRRISDRRFLWEANVFGRQVIWEAEIVANESGKRIRWESRRGASNEGEVSFEELPRGRTRLTVDLTCRPRGMVERLGARLGLLRHQIRSDLVRFRDHMTRSLRGSSPREPRRSSPGARRSRRRP